MEGYKAFNAGWKCRDFQHEIGKTYELPEGQTLKMCECGFHFCKNPIDVFGYYPMDDSVLLAKVEALGEIRQEGTKFVTDKIKIVREFTRKELQALILDGNHNSGNRNSGDYNSGNYNSGIFNSDEPYMRAFNRKTTVKYSDFMKDLPYNFYDLCNRIQRNALVDGDAEKIKALPNFDADIFKEITGIDLRGEEE